MWDPSLSSFSVWSLEAASGREMKDLKIWIQLRRSEGNIVTDLVTQNLLDLALLTKLVLIICIA